MRFTQKHMPGCSVGASKRGTNAWEIVIEAERKAVEFLKGLQKNREGRPKLAAERQVSSFDRGLEEIGISHQEATRWRAVAEVPGTVLAN
jgi:hypothetical protein